MNITASDINTVGEVEATVFDMLQNTPVAALITLTNSGINTANYKFQEKIGTTWTDLDALGTDVNNTLSPAQTRAIVVVSTYPQVRLRASASGGALFEFAVLRHFDRGDGGAIPLLSL